MVLIVLDCVWAPPLTSTKIGLGVCVCAAAGEVPAKVKAAINAASFVLCVIDVLVVG